LEAKPSRRATRCPRIPGSATQRSSRPSPVQLDRSSPERSIRQLPYELGISDQTLGNWIKLAQIDHGERERLTNEERWLTSRR